MKTIMKWTEKEKDFITNNLNAMSNKKLAESLKRTSKMIGSYLWKNHITRDKKGIKSAANISKKVVVDTIKTTSTNVKKFRKATLKSFVTKSDSFKIDYFELLKKLQKCASKNLCSALAGHQKLGHVTQNFFCRNQTNEFLYFVEADDKSFFVKTNIYSGVSLIADNKSSKDALDSWKKNYEINGVKK